MEIIAGTPVLRKEEPVLLLSPVRGPAQIKDLSMILVGDTTSENAGGRPKGVSSMEIWDIVFAIVRRDRIPV